MPPASRLILLAVFAAALAAAFWRAPKAAATAFSPPPEAAKSELPSLYASELLTQPANLAGRPSLAELPDGRIAAAWLTEGEDGPIIRFSVRERGGWRPSTAIADRAGTAGGAFAYVGEIGPPVLYAEGSWLHLWYASRTLGGSINHSLSTDGGRNWSRPSRLQTSPWANFGGGVRAAPVPLADGGLGLVIGHGFAGRHGEWLRLAATGGIVDKLRLPATSVTAQPAMAVLDAHSALAVQPDAEGRLRPLTSVDDGRHWLAGEALTGPDAKAPLALLRLRSGRLLLAGNRSDGRPGVGLWLSADRGKTWVSALGIAPPAERAAYFANPALLLGRDGLIHLACDRRRQGIVHVVFSEAWLDGATP